MLLFRSGAEFWPDRLVGLSSSSLKLYWNIDLILLSFIQVDREINEFELSINNAF